MNHKLIVLGIWVSLLSFFGCKPDSKEIINFNDFYKSPSSDVYVKFEDGFKVLNVILIKSKTRLQSKTTTIINSDLICQTNVRDVLIILSRTKRINQHLKTIRDRKPYVDGFEKTLLNSDVTKVELSELFFEQDTSYKEYQEFVVLREVSVKE